MKFIVENIFSIWLLQTQTWMVHQINNLYDEMENHIVCEVTENIYQFWLTNIHNLSETPNWPYYWDLWLRKIGVRNHLGYFVSQAKKYYALLLHSYFGNVGWKKMALARKTILMQVVNFYGFNINYLPTTGRFWNSASR